MDNLDWRFCVQSKGLEVAEQRHVQSSRFSVTEWPANCLRSRLGLYFVGYWLAARLSICLRSGQITESRSTGRKACDRIFENKHKCDSSSTAATTIIIIKAALWWSWELPKELFIFANCCVSPVLGNVTDSPPNGRSGDNRLPLFRLFGARFKLCDWVEPDDDDVVEAGSGNAKYCDFAGGGRFIFDSVDAQTVLKRRPDELSKFFGKFLFLFYFSHEELSNLSNSVCEGDDREWVKLRKYGEWFIRGRGGGNAFGNWSTLEIRDDTRRWDMYNYL